MSGPAKPVPAHVISLGCPKNRVDTEKFLNSLDVPLQLGCPPEKSRLLFVNTCAFIEPAVRESLRSILELERQRLKKSGKRVLAVMGCLPERYGFAELKKEFPGVDLWIDSRQLEAGAHKLATLLADGKTARKTDFITSSPSYGYVKISDGCDHGCSFCAIPHFKGPFRSIAADEIIADAQRLLAKDIHELILVAQDLLSWGRDLPEKASFTSLLEKLLPLPGLRWLRMLYLYPALLDQKLLRFVASASLPLLPYLDVPFQHSEETILRSMGRPFARNPRKVIEEIRRFLPDAAIRTTLIVGYPGETDEDFKRLCEFVRESAFTHLGVFTYHAEEGTRAAALHGQIPEHVRQERKEALLEVQASISRDFLAAFLASQMDVMVDETDFEEWAGLYKGRVWFQAPEIDGLTYISGEELKIGSLVNAEIASSSDYDLSALALTPKQ